MKKAGCLTYVVIIIISSVAALMLVGVLDDQSISVPDSGSNFHDYVDVDDEESEGITDITEEDTYHNNTEGVFYAYYDQLNTEEKYIYDVILDGVSDGKETFKFENVNHNDYSIYCDRAVYALTYDHPELFWLQCGYSITKWHALFEEYGDIELDLEYYSYWEYSMEKNKKIEELENAVEKVVTQALKQETDYERIQYVHDYLVENAIYDYDSLNEYYKTFHDASCEYIFSAYGCLVNGKTVCSGYAKAFQLIMQKLGYDCMYVVGEAGESHAWNCIYIENEGYFVDVTWDDPDYVYDEPKYEYFCITSESLARTHELDKTFDVPDCDAKEFNYFEYYGFRLDTYDFSDLCDVVEAQKEQHIINVQFGSMKELTKAYEDLFSNGNIYKIPVLSNTHEISYSINEDHYTLTIYKK